MANTKDNGKLEFYSKHGFNKNKLAEVQSYIKNLIKRAEMALKENL